MVVVVDWRMIRTLMLALLAGTATHCTTGLDVSLVQPVALSTRANLSRTAAPTVLCSTSNTPGASLFSNQWSPSVLCC